MSDCNLPLWIDRYTPRLAASHSGRIEEEQVLVPSNINYNTASEGLLAMSVAGESTTNADKTELSQGRRRRRRRKSPHVNCMWEEQSSWKLSREDLSPRTPVLEHRMSKFRKRAHRSGDIHRERDLVEKCQDATAFQSKGNTSPAMSVEDSYIVEMSTDCDRGILAYTPSILESLCPQYPDQRNTTRETSVFENCQQISHFPTSVPTNVMEQIRSKIRLQEVRATRHFLLSSGKKY